MTRNRQAIGTKLIQSNEQDIHGHWYRSVV
jgi:hypothetical protein